MWKKVTGQIIRDGKYWSTTNLSPSPEDINAIIALADGEVYVCRQNKNTLIFRDNVFVETGAFFCPGAVPKFAVEKDYEILFWCKRLGEFSVNQLAECMWPGAFLKGKAWRNPNDHNMWSREETEECSESHDFGAIARTRASNFIYNKARKEGWVEQVERGKWRTTY